MKYLNKCGKWIFTLVIVIMVVSLAVGIFNSTKVSAWEGREGRTPCFWKNHPDAWPPGYAPPLTIVSHNGFSGASAFPSLASQTFLQALQFPWWGRGAEGAARILLRAGVAALLNASSPNVHYIWPQGYIQDMVNAALLSGDRDAMLALATELYTYNNFGCPEDD